MKANGVTLVAHSRQQHSLHRLLDSVEKTHRDDIDTYSKGHLNEGKLYKLQTGPGSKHKPWKSSSSKAGHLPTQSAEVERRAYSTESYLSDRDVARGDVVDAVKPSFPQTNQIRPAWAVSIEDDSMAEAQLLGALKDKNLQAFQRSLPLHAGNGAITRKDHLRQMREIDRKVIGRSDQHERRAMSGMKAVEHLEKKLREVIQLKINLSLGDIILLVLAMQKMLNDMLMDVYLIYFLGFASITGWKLLKAQF